MHHLAVRQVTAASCPPRPPSDGALTTLQALPFHTSVSGWVQTLCGYLLLPCSPTAMQNVVETQATLLKTLLPDSAGRSVCIHEVPSHVETAAERLVAPYGLVLPTATQNVAEVQERSLRLWPVATIPADHEAPSQVSLSAVMLTDGS